MNRIHSRRLIYIFIFMVSLSTAVSFILYALKQNINAFFTPTELTTLAHPPHIFRLGGMVKANSLVRNKNNLGVEFLVTDFKHEILVKYQGILPDLFREGKGMIAEGSMKQRVFMANRILAKHDENYRPPQQAVKFVNSSPKELIS